MICVSLEFVPGYRVRKVLSIVWGNTIRARGFGKDITAVMRNMIGGEITEYTKLIAESREQAVDRMKEKAHELGANAVIGVRFATSAVMSGAAEILAYGTAVVLEEDPHAPDHHRGEQGVADRFPDEITPTIDEAQPGPPDADPNARA